MLQSIKIPVGVSCVVPNFFLENAKMHSLYWLRLNLTVNLPVSEQSYSYCHLFFEISFQI